MTTNLIENIIWNSLNNSNLLFCIDFEDFNKIKNYKWHLSTQGYVVGRLNSYSRLRPIHRVILGIKDSSVTIDHIDRNKLNNCKTNLRIVTPQENSFNCTKQSGIYSSKFIGVLFRKDNKTNPWTASVRDNGKLIHLGFYSTEELAAKARDRYMIKYFSRCALLNFPLDTYIE